MNVAKIFILLLVFSGSALADDAAAPLQTNATMQVAIQATNATSARSAVRIFSFACGILALTAAVQQALFPLKPRRAKATVRAED